MGEKPAFPKVNLKYPTLESFAKAVRKSFGQGRLLVRLKKEFNSGQRLILIFQLGDWPSPVEIIGQVIDRVEDKEKGKFAYGIRFLNFTENKLNRLLAGEEIKPPEKPVEDKPPEPIPAPTPKSAPKEIAAPAPPAPVPAPEKVEPKPAPVPKEAAKPAPVEVAAEKVPEPNLEIEVTLQAGSTQSFDGREIEAGKETEPEQPAPEPEGPAIEIEPEAPAAVPEETSTPPPAQPEPVETNNEEPGAPAADPAPPLENGFQLTEPIPLEEEPEPEPLVEVMLPGSEASLFGSEPDLLIGDAPARTEPVAAKQVPAEAVQELEPASVAKPAALPLLEDDLGDLEFSPMPEFLKEAKPLPKAKPVPLPPPAEVPIETLTDEEPLLLEEKPGSQKPPTPASPESKLAAAEPAPEFKSISPERLSDFLFRFCRIILNPPPPDLPDSAKQIQSLFEDFQKLMESRERIGIYLVLAASGKDFIIEGAQASPKSIRILLPPEMVGTLLFRLIELFDEKELVGIIFRKYLELSHFQIFISALARFNPEKESADELARKLIQSGIFYFSLIFETDLVAVPEKIKEDTKIVLARLTAELKRLKVLAEQISEEPLALLTLRLEDIIRPVADQEVLAQVLEHLPLIWNDQIQDFEFQDLEDQILFSIPVPALFKASEILFKKLIQAKGLKPAKPGGVDKNKPNLERLLRRVMARIAYEAPEQALQILSELFDRQLIKYEELPEDIRDQVAASKLGQEFLRSPEARLSQLQIAHSAGAYSRLASQMIWSSIALLDKKEYKWAQKIFQTLVAHYQDKSPPFPERPKLARDSLKRLSEPFAIELLARILQSGKKEERDLAASMLYATGEACVKKLMVLLEQSEDRNVRRLACEVLARFGPNLEPTLLAKLNEPGLPWYLTRNLVMILAEIKSPSLRDQIGKLLKHPHMRVREEAINYLLATGDKQLEPVLAQMLKDPELAVRRRALGAMGKLENISPETALSIKILINDLSASELEGNAETVFLQAIELLVRTGLDKLPDRTDLSEFLFSLLEQTEAHGIFSRTKLGLTPKIKIALIEALGKRKHHPAKKLLSRLAKDKDNPLRKPAEKALEMMGKN